MARGSMVMKRFLACAVALLLVAVGAPVMAAAMGGDDSGGSEASPADYERAVKLIEAADYGAAVRILEKANRKESGNADVLNMLGYAHRKLGRMETALGFYQEALAIEPRHLGANEYLGELYLRESWASCTWRRRRAREGGGAPRRGGSWQICLSLGMRGGSRRARRGDRRLQERARDGIAASVRRTGRSGTGKRPAATHRDWRCPCTFGACTPRPYSCCA